MRNGTYIRALGRLPFAPVENGQQPASNSGDNNNNDTSAGTAAAEGLFVEGHAGTSSAAAAAAPGANTSRSRSDGNPQHPARLARNRVIAAQNDVLATVGVCLRETAKNDPEKRTTLFIRENEIGLVVGAVDLTLGFLVNWPLAGIRNRLQTFRALKHISYFDLVKLIWKNEGIVGFYAGMAPNLVFQILSIGCDYVQSQATSRLARTSLFRDPETGDLRQHAITSLLALDKLMNFMFWATIQPFYRYSTLQELQLVPPFPLIPPLPMILLPFSFSTAAGEPFYPSLSANNWSFFRIFNNYAFLNYLQQFFYRKLQLYLFKTLRKQLPRPDNPDRASVEAAYVGDHSDTDEEQRRRQRRRRRRARAWGARGSDGNSQTTQIPPDLLRRLQSSPQSGSWPLSREEQQQIYNQAVENGMEVVFDSESLHIRNPLTGEQMDYLIEELFPSVGGRLNNISAAQTLTETSIIPTDISSTDSNPLSTSVSTLQNTQNTQPSMLSAEGIANQPEQPEQPEQPAPRPNSEPRRQGVSTALVQTEEDEEVALANLATLPPIHTHTPPPEASAPALVSSSSQLPIVIPPRSSSLSAPTVAATAGSAPATPSFLAPLIESSAWARRRDRNNRRYHSRPRNPQSLHRLTALSCHPCDAAASHIADVVSTGLFLGIENIVLRALAGQFVRQQGGVVNVPSVGLVTTNDIYGVWGWKAIFEGTGGVLKALIVDYTFSWLLWEFNTGVIEQVGKRMFGYRRNSLF